MKHEKRVKVEEYKFLLSRSIRLFFIFIIGFLTQHKYVLKSVHILVSFSCCWVAIEWSTLWKMQVYMLWRLSSAEIFQLFSQCVGDFHSLFILCYLSHNNILPNCMGNCVSKLSGREHAFSNNKIWIINSY